MVEERIQEYILEKVEKIVNIISKNNDDSSIINVYEKRLNIIQDKKLKISEKLDYCNTCLLNEYRLKILCILRKEMISLVISDKTIDDISKNLSPYKGGSFLSKRIREEVSEKIHFLYGI